MEAKASWGVETAQPTKEASMPVDKSTKIAIITGSSRGLGRNTALSLARTGTDIIVTYQSNRAEAESAVAEIQALGRKAVAFQLDAGEVSSFDAFAANVKAALAEKWGRHDFDFLVNNAGAQRRGEIAEASEADVDALFAMHFKGPFFLVQKLLPLMAQGGRVINISSGLARMTMPGNAAYASMKAAVETLTRYMAKELAPHGITVNVVAPGAIETDFGGGTVRDNPDYNRMVASMTALGRVGLPDDIGPMIASLLSDANRWVTGQRIEVSGGQAL